MTDDKNKRKLYDALSKEYDLGTFEQFSSDVEDEGKRQKLYNAIKDEYDLPDFDGFTNQLIGGSSQASTSTASAAGSTPAAGSRNMFPNGPVPLEQLEGNNGSQMFVDTPVMRQMRENGLGWWRGQQQTAGQGEEGKKSSSTARNTSTQSASASNAASSSGENEKPLGPENFQKYMDMKMRTDKMMSDVTRNMERVRRGNELFSDRKGVEYNPTTGEFEDVYYTTNGEYSTSRVARDKRNKELFYATEEGQKQREKELNYSIDKVYDDYSDYLDNAVNSAWEEADRISSTVPQRKLAQTKNAISFAAGPANPFGMVGHLLTAANSVLKESKALEAHDLDRMSENAWNGLGSNKKKRMIDEIFQKLSREYLVGVDVNHIAQMANNPSIFQPTEEERAQIEAYEKLRKYAEQLARTEVDRRIYEKAKDMNAPQNWIDYLATRMIEGQMVNMSLAMVSRKMAGTTGDWAAKDVAMNEYGESHWLLDKAGTVLAFVTDPTTWVSGEFGGAVAKTVVKGTLKKATKEAGEAAIKEALEATGRKYWQGAVSSGVSLGTINTIGELSNQGKYGGVLEGFDESGRYIIGDYDLWKVAESGAEGLVLGGLTGVTGRFYRNVGTKLAVDTESTVGKGLVRGGEDVLSVLTRGTIFEAPQAIRRWKEYDEKIASLSDPKSANYIADDAEREKKIAELKEERGDVILDEWGDNIATMAAFHIEGKVKSAPQVLRALSKGKGDRAGFETRLRRVLDGVEPDLALTKEERAELERGGYTDLKELVEDYGRYEEERKRSGKAKEENAGKKANWTNAQLEAGEGDGLPYNRFVELVNDKSISEAARAKMYYYVTGRTLPMSTIMGSSPIEEVKDANGKVTGYRVKSFGANGVITSRTFGSEREARMEQQRIDRQVELNSAYIGEQFFDKNESERMAKDACDVVGKRRGVTGEELYKMLQRDPSQRIAVENEWVKEIENEIVLLDKDNYGSESLRKYLNEKYDVDIDKVIGKEPKRRSEKEKEALHEYYERLFTEEKKEADTPREIGYDASDTERKDIAIALAEAPEKQENREAWEGVMQRIEDDADYKTAEYRGTYDRISRKDGSVVGVKLKEKYQSGDFKGLEKDGWVVDGDVVLREDGSVDEAKSTETLIVVDGETGERRVMSPKDILGVDQMTSKEEVDADVARYRKELVDAALRDAEGIVDVQPGYRFKTPEGEDAEVIAVDGDEAVYKVDGKDYQMGIKTKALQEMADRQAYEAYVERKRRRGEEAVDESAVRDEKAVEVAEERKGKPEVFEPYMEVTIKDEDGKEKTVVVTGVRARWEDGKFIEDPNGRYVEMYDPEAGAMTYIHETDPKKQIVGWKEAPKEEPSREVIESRDDQEPPDDGGTPPPPPAGVKVLKDAKTFEEQEKEQKGPKVKTPETFTPDTYLPESKVTMPAAPVSDNAVAMPMVENTKGRGKTKRTETSPDWYAATPSRAQHYIYNELGFTPEVADEVVKANMAEIDKAIADKQKKEPKPTANPVAYKEAHDAWESEMQELRDNQQYWKEVRSIRNRQILAEAEERDRAKAEARERAAEQKALEAQQRAEEEAIARQKQEEARERAAAAADAEEEHFLENEIIDGIRKEMGSEYELGLQEREKKINNAISMKQKRAAAREIYGELYNDDLEVPADVKEYVSMHLVAKEEKDKVNWDMVDDRYGVKQEIGGTSNGGKKKGKNAGDFDHLGAVISFDNKGKSFQQAAHDMWDSAENTLPGGYKRFDDQDIRNAMIDIISSAESITDITQYSFKNRVKNAEESMESQMNDAIGREVDWRIQQSGLTWGEYLEWYRETKEKAAAVGGMTEEEFTNTIILGENGNRGTEESIDGAQPGSPVVGEERPRESGNDGRGREAGSEALRGAEGERPGVVQDSGRGNEEVAGGERAAIAERISAAESQTDTNPTEGQKKAGNYAKGHLTLDGYNISIEQPKGSIRRGVEADGRAWEQEMHNTYGYIRGTEGVDGDHIDVFLSDDPTQGNVFVIDQVNKDGSFDEHKVMYGFPDAESARQAYLSNYEDGWQGLGTITEVSKDEFKKWVESSHRKTKPFSEYKSVEKLGGQNEVADEEALASRMELDYDGETAEEGPNGTIYRRPIVIDGIHRVEQVDKPDEKGHYTGSYYMYNGKRYGDLREVFDKIDTMTAEDVEAGGAVVDKLQSMGVEVSTDIAENRKVRKQAEQDNSEAGKIHDLKTTDGTVYGFTYRGGIYLDPRKIDAELPLHEYGHLWTEAYRILNPEGWKDVVETIKKDVYGWNFVRERYPDLESDSEIADEVIATFSGKKGAEKLKAELERMAASNTDYKSRWGNIYNNIVKAIQDFWKKIGDFLGIKYKSAEQVYDQVLKDFAAGMNPRARVEEYLLERDETYMDAAERGDVAQATEIFTQALSEEIGNGMTPFVAVGKYSDVRDLAKKVKTRDPKVIQQVAEMMAPLIPENAVLVPVPSHVGEATDMLDLAKAIAKIKGCEVADVLKSAPRESQYQTKKESGQAITADQMGITVNGNLPEGKIPVVVDNVVDSGNTAEACVKALGKGIVVSLGDSADMYGHAATLKSAAPILKGRDGKVVPLSKRFDLGGSQYLGRPQMQKSGDELQKPTNEQKTLVKALSDMINTTGIKSHLVVRKGQEVLDKYRDIAKLLQAWHGSGADFEQFENSHIGEGMGVQRHGHGFYVTTHQGAAKGYAKDVAQSHDETPIVYEVEIPEDNGKNYIDWTAIIPKSERKKIAEAVRAIPEERLTRERHGNNWLPGGFGQLADMIERNSWGGADLYYRLYDATGSTKLTSDLLSGLGYKGVRVHEWSMPKGEYTYVIFNDNDLKITDKIRFQRAADGEYEPKSVFYSNAMNAVEGIKQEKATAEQWLAMLQKNGGLKAGEDKWIGLSDWLNDHKGKSLTKQEVLDYIRENAIQIEEVEYYDAHAGVPAGYGNSLREEAHDLANNTLAEEFAKNLEEGMSREDAEDRAWNTVKQRMLDEYGSGVMSYFGIHLNEDGEPEVYTTGTDRAFNDFADTVWHRKNGDSENAKEANATRMSYTTKGLKNKREIALTIPTIEPWNENDDVHFGDAGEGRAVAWVRFGETYLPSEEQKAASKAVDDFFDEMRAKYGVEKGDETSFLDKMSKEEIAEMQRLTAAEAEAKEKPGIKVLVIDEIQSKRHKEGRVKGYRKVQSNSQRARHIKAQEKFESFKTELVEKYGSVLDNGSYNQWMSLFSPAELERYEQLEREVMETSFYDEAESPTVNDNRVPDAPFDKNWHELAMKRMLRYAAENGYDKVAWTTGEQQADRYDLSKEIREIKIRKDGRTTPEGEALYEVYTYDTNTDNEIASASGMFNATRLKETFGKDLASRLEKVAEESQTNGAWDGFGSIAGNGLRIGGEGKKGFYDQILPRFADKYGKKWNVKTTDINLPNIGDNGLKMWSVDVTPEMKASVLEGQPMFFKTPEGEVYGFTVDGEIYIDPRYARPDTPIHEYTHLWAQGLRNRNAAAWKQLTNEMKTVEGGRLWDYVKGRYPELKTEDELVEEVFAHYSGKRGAERLEKEMREEMKKANGIFEKAQVANIFHKLRDVLQKFWNMARDLFAGKVKGVENLSAEDFADMVLGDLLGGFDPRVENKERVKERDKAYMEAVERGDMETAQRMVDAEARRKGYISGADYRMTHRAPNREDDVSLADLSGNSIVPDDYWTHPQYYQYEPYDYQSFYQIRNAMNNAAEKKAAGKKAVGSITMYRAVPKSVKEDTFRNGDWISPSLTYAKQEGESIPGGYRIISMKCKSSNVWWDANDINEWGYDDGKDYAYKNTKNNRKLLDAVTYDDNGDVIPLSKRFNSRNSDIRFKKSGTYTTKDGVQLSMMSLFEGNENLNDNANLNDKGDLTALRLRKLEPGEMCHVERRYEENKQFSFMGKERIESMDDVAYIFKQLENAAVENSFIALVKDGKPTIIHTGMGSYAATSVDVRQAMVAYEAIKPDKVYFIHNHPSGTLKASTDDRNTLQAMRAIFGNDVVQDGIIIDTTSGKYGVFGWDVSERDMQEGGDEVPLKVYEFSKQVFSEDWKPQTAYKITDSKDIAKFISSQKYGKHPKMNFIVVNNQLQVVSNLFLPWTKLSDIKDMDAACRKLSGDINQAGGVKGIIYGNYQYDKKDKRLLQQLTAGMQTMKTPLMDVVHVDVKDVAGYHSAHDEGVMEPEEVYVTPKREADEDIFDYAKRIADDYSAYEAIMKAYEDVHGGVMEAHDDSGKYEVPKRKPGESPIDYAKRVAESYSAYNEKRDALNKAAERQISHINNDGTDDIWKDKGFNMQERIIMAAASLAKRNKNNKKLQYDVQKSIVKNLNDIRKKIGTQTGYDSETVMRVANQARIMDQLGMLDEDSREAIDLLMSEVQRNFGGENIDNDIRKVVDILSNVTSENIKKVEKIISTDKYDVPKAQAKESYERMMASGRNQFVEAVQDKMQSLKLLYKSILEGEGKDKVRVEDVAGYENAILAENRMSGANNKQTFAWIKTYMEPLTDEVYKLCKGKRLLRKGYRKDLYNELVNYMLAKHGLERNDVFAKREARKAYNDEYDAAVREMNNTQGLALKELKNKLDNNKIDKDTYEREVEKFRLDVERLKLQFAEDRDAKIASFETNPESDSKYMEYSGQDYAGLTSLTGEADVNKAETEAQRIVDEYEAKHDTKALWEKINDATKSSLRKLYDSGMMSTERYEKIRDMFQYYIPLQGFDEKVAENVYAYMGSDGTLGYGTPIRAAKGRKSKADDPLATIRMNGEAAIRQANRNEMKQHFLRFVQNHPSDLVSINDVWLRKNDVTGEWEQYFDADLKETDTPADVQKKVYEFEKKMEALANEKPDEYKRSKDLPNVPFRVVDDRDMRQHQVLVNSAGKSYVLTVNGNPRAAQALNGLTNPDVNTESLVGKALNMAQSATRFRSLLVTSLSPEFVLSNYLRDMGYSNLMVWVKENPRYAAEFNKQFAALGFPTGIKIFKKDFENMGSLYVKWKSGKLLEKINNGTANEREKMFYEFQMNGGETGWTSWHNIEQHKKDLEKTLKRSGKISKKFWGLFEGWLDLFNQVVENNARFAAYVTSRKTGRSIEHSIRDAKEISVNFNTKGAGDKFITAKGQKTLGIAGSVIGGYGRGFMMFFNAGIQGTFGNFAKNILRHPAKGAGLISAMAALGYFAPIISDALCNAFGADGDDDDDKNSYYNLPEYKRRTNLCFRWDKDMPWITIPLPIEYRAAYGIGELTQGIVSGKERYSEAEAAEQYASQLSQLLPKDILEGRGLHLDFGFWPSILTPSILEPIAQANDNVSWTGLPIYREEPIYYKGKGDPKKYYPQWRYRPFDSADKTLIYATKWLNEATGGDDVKQGWIDWNPSKIEYLINQYLGGPMQMVGKVKKTIETATGDRDFEWRNTPFLNRVLYEGDERTAARKLQNEYYKLLDEYFETGAVHKGYEELAKGDGKDAEKYRRKLKELEESDAYKHFQIFDKYNDICYDYYKLQKDAEGEEKKKYQKIQNELNRRLVKIVHASDDGDEDKVRQAEQEMEEYIKTLN